jgi:hypothetical protein
MAQIEATFNDENATKARARRTPVVLIHAATFPIAMA